MTDTRTVKRLLLYIVGAVLLVFGLIQLVPYRVTNPSTHREPTWDSPRTRQLASVACFDCHSNDTTTVWWEKVAPLSWWITNHVDDGRRALNFSECTRRAGGESGDAAETVTKGSMPPSYYTWFGMHSNATLTASQRAALAAGLQRTLQGWNCGHGHG